MLIWADSVTILLKYKTTNFTPIKEVSFYDLDLMTGTGFSVILYGLRVWLVGLAWSAQSILHVSVIVRELEDKAVGGLSAVLVSLMGTFWFDPPAAD